MAATGWGATGGATVASVLLEALEQMVSQWLRISVSSFNNGCGFLAKCLASKRCSGFQRGGSSGRDITDRNAWAVSPQPTVVPRHLLVVVVVVVVVVLVVSLFVVAVVVVMTSGIVLVVRETTAVLDLDLDLVV